MTVFTEEMCSCELVMWNEAPFLRTNSVKVCLIYLAEGRNGELFYAGLHSGDTVVMEAYTPRPTRRSNIRVVLFFSNEMIILRDVNTAAIRQSNQ